MSEDELKAALQAYRSRRPFRPFLIEFSSGSEVLVPHPEAVDHRGALFHYRGPKRAQSLFTAASVCRLLDLPTIIVS
jgi:hypothetical protein